MNKLAQQRTKIHSHPVASVDDVCMCIFHHSVRQDAKAIVVCVSRDSIDN